MPSLLYEAVRCALVAACAVCQKVCIAVDVRLAPTGYGTERTENPHDYHYLDCLSGSLSLLRILSFVSNFSAARTWRMKSCTVLRNNSLSRNIHLYVWHSERSAQVL